MVLSTIFRSVSWYIMPLWSGLKCLAKKCGLLWLMLMSFYRLLSRECLNFRKISLTVTGIGREAIAVGHVCQWEVRTGKKKKKKNLI